MKYVCEKCGAISLKWSGNCSECGEWNCITKQSDNIHNPFQSDKNTSFEVFSIDQDIKVTDRLHVACEEFNRVCGGGLVPGSIVLIGGSPGIGKSTLLLQVASAIVDYNLAKKELSGEVKKVKTAYISGEESVEQVSLRAKRLKIGENSLTEILLASETKIDSVISYLESNKDIKLVIIDSIHTMRMAGIESVPGSVNQIRAATQAIMDFCKSKGMVFILVGHVTKEGIISGPKLLEHMVDVVLYLESSGSYRLLRAAKNRFGSISEIGIFEMSQDGLIEVKNSSTIFLNDDNNEKIGSCIYSNMDGNRPILMEVQSLVSPTNFQNPRRSVVGWDYNRLSIIIAVMDSIEKVSLSNKDIYVNIAGGFKVLEPAADLAVVFSLISCLKKKIVSKGWVAFGEIGLSGEVRAVQNQTRRVEEAIKIGFKNILLAYSKEDSKLELPQGVKLHFVKNIFEIFSLI